MNDREEIITNGAEPISVGLGAQHGGHSLLWLQGEEQPIFENLTDAGTSR